MSDLLEGRIRTKETEYELLRMSSSGKKISNEFAEVLYLLDNTNTPLDGTLLERVYSVPEVAEGMTRLAAKEKTYTAAREKYWTAWIEKLKSNNGFAQKEDIVYNGKVEKGHKAFLVLGLPASGKSSVITNKLLKDNKAFLLDSDEAKKMIPEYDNGWGAGAVHVESKAIHAREFEQFTTPGTPDYGKNVVIPIVGDKTKKVKLLIDTLKASGYTVELHLVEVMAKTSLSRLLKRFIDDNRFLDPSLVFRYGDRPSCVFEELKGEADAYYKWSNEVGQGEEPICIDSSSREVTEDLGRGGEIRRGISTESSGKIEEKTAGKELVDISKLAEEMATFMDDLDPYEFRDCYDSFEDSVEEFTNIISTRDGIESILDEVRDDIDATCEPREYLQGCKILVKLNYSVGKVSTNEYKREQAQLDEKEKLLDCIEQNDIALSIEAFNKAAEEYLREQQLAAEQEAKIRDEERIKEEEKESEKMQRFIESVAFTSVVLASKLKR